jgi:hypothetical protein
MLEAESNKKLDEITTLTLPDTACTATENALSIGQIRHPL